MKKIIRYFLQGLLYIAPVAVTVYIIIISFFWLDGLLRDLEIFKEQPLSAFNFPGLGLIIILITVTLIGFVGQKLITSPISLLFD